MGGEESGDVAKLSPLENIGLGVAAGALGQRDAAGHKSCALGQRDAAGDTSWLCPL